MGFPNFARRDSIPKLQRLKMLKYNYFLNGYHFFNGLLNRFDSCDLKFSRFVNMENRARSQFIINII